jgi:hypothetical protein
VLIRLECLTVLQALLFALTPHLPSRLLFRAVEGAVAIGLLG